MSQPTIGVFPCAGGLGGATSRNLLSLVDPSRLVLLCRNPSKLAAEEKAGATVRQADYDNAFSLDKAFEGIDVLNLISYVTFVIEHRVKVHKRAIDAAIRSGVKTIIYSSLAFAGDCKDTSLATVMQAHLQTEAYLRFIQSNDPSFSYLIVRQGLYHESAPLYLGGLNPKNPPNELLIPHDGKGAGIAWAAREELGEATAKIIQRFASDRAGLENTCLLLSGPKVLSLQETADVYGQILRTALPIRKVSVAEYAAQDHIKIALDNKGELWANAWEAVRQGETAVLSPNLEHWLGRTPEAFEVTIKNMLKDL